MPGTEPAAWIDDADARQRIGEVLLGCGAVAFRWAAAPGWPVLLVSGNVRHWGLDPDALLRGEISFAELVHPADLVRVAAEVTYYSERGQAHFRQEYRLRDGSDGWRWVEDHTWIERSPSGQVQTYNGILIDVSERKRAEIALELAARTVPDLLDSDSLAQGLDEALGRLGEGMGADRVYLFELHQEPNEGRLLASQRYEWCNTGIDPQIDNPALQNLEFNSAVPRWYLTLSDDRAIKGSVRDFPETEREVLDPQGIQSLLVVPVRLHGRLWGFLGLDAVREERLWSPWDERVLRLIAAALAASIEQQRSIEAIRDSEERQRLALDGANAGSWEWSPAHGSRWSMRTYELLGQSPERQQADLNAWLQVIHPEDRDWVERSMRGAQLAGTALSIEFRVVVGGERVRWLQAFAKPRYNAVGEMDGLVGIVLDIDERKQAEENLRLASAVIDNTRDGVIVTGLDARILSVNKAYCEITGYAEEELVGQNPRIMQSGRHDRAFYERMWRSLLDSGSWQGEIWSRRRNGEVFPERLTITTVRDERGRVRNYVGVITDLSRLKQTEDELSRVAHYDPLTGLPNRLLAQTRLEHAIAYAEQQEQMVAVLFLGMDRFKTINDGLGHEVGDTLLCAVATRLVETLQEGQTIARLGGDEFLLIAESLQGAREAAELAQELMQTLRAPFHLPSGHEIYAEASVGISVFPADGNTASDLVRNADAALFRAKNIGRNTFHFFTPALLQHANERFELESQLRRAVARREFVVHYQPVLDCDSCELRGVEALVRWQPPGREMVLPAAFIEIAEDTGLILAIGEVVLEIACRQIQRWRRRAPDLRLSVNLSMRQLREADFADRLLQILAQTGLDPQALELEVTESMLMAEGKLVVATLKHLRQHGVRIAIDDFGTGYSSLAHLRRLPLDTLKIDRSFILDIERDDEDADIAAAIIALAHQLHLDVIAEGVETRAQLNHLQRLGCDLFQGYLTSAPLAAEDLASRHLPTS